MAYWSYRNLISWKNKTGLLSSCDYVKTTVWMNHMDANEAHGSNTQQIEIKKENEKRNKYLDHAGVLKICGTWVSVIPIVIGALGTISEGLVQGIGKAVNWRKRRDNTKYSIKIGQNTEKSSRNLRKLIVTHILVRNFVRSDIIISV